MDPLGFALENFDAIGAWRTKDGTTSIDATATMPGAATFTGPEELRAFLLSRRDQFVDTVASGLLTYAIGRSLEYYDMPAVRAIVHKAAIRDYRWSSLLLGIVKSPPFQMRRARAQNTNVTAEDGATTLPSAAARNTHSR
jgi:hypothetical protein